MDCIFIYCVCMRVPTSVSIEQHCHLVAKCTLSQYGGELLWLDSQVMIRSASLEAAAAGS